MATGLERGTGDTQQFHVALETVGLLGGQRLPWHVLLLGLGEQMIVDVGDVAAHLDGVPGQTQDPGGHVGPDERGGVTQMRGVIRGNAADVDAPRTQDG